tara:strand:+ start:655 stop:900 length:246 start_codon:yes stop_codon:yes gene_type:complete
MNDNTIRYKVPNSRYEDIRIRGEELKVFNFKGEVVKLKDCDIWKNTYGDYWPPDEYICVKEDNIFKKLLKKIIKRIRFCML